LVEDARYVAGVKAAPFLPQDKRFLVSTEQSQNDMNRRMTRATFTIAFVFLCGTATAASRVNVTLPITVSPKQLAKMTIYKPQIQYPEPARLRRITGDGFFKVRVLKSSGRVKQVSVLQTTGNDLLDAAAMKGLSQCRFKPGVLRSIKELNAHSNDPLAGEECLLRVPVSFSLTRNGLVTKGHSKGLLLHEAMSRAAQGEH
jgi:TonB family protein